MLHTAHVVLVTLDGLRWQEVFTGADRALIDHEDFVSEPEDLRERFWSEDPMLRREKLLPFFWSVLATEGQLYGNRLEGSKVNVTNGHWFSYPGYNEILTGRADDRIDSNDKRENPNVTVRVLSVSLTDFLRRRLVSLATQRKGVAVARRKSGKSESVQVEKARKKFVAWRRSRKARSRIPEELWTSAVVAARDIGVNQACKALRLDYYALKRRVVASPEMPSVKASGNFVEFDSGVSPLFTEWAVEMDNGSGARMRVAARSVSGPDVVALSRTFFGEES